MTLPVDTGTAGLLPYVFNEGCAKGCFPIARLSCGAGYELVILAEEYKKLHTLHR